MGLDSKGTDRGACRMCHAANCSEYHAPAEGEDCATCGCRPNAHAKQSPAPAPVAAAAPSLAGPPRGGSAKGLAPLKATRLALTPLKPTPPSSSSSSGGGGGGGGGSSMSRREQASPRSQRSQRSPRSPNSGPEFELPTKAEMQSRRRKLQLAEQKERKAEQASQGRGGDSSGADTPSSSSRFQSLKARFASPSNAGGSETDSASRVGSAPSPASKKGRRGSVASRRRESLKSQMETVSATPEELADKAAAHLAARDAQGAEGEEEGAQKSSFHPIIRPDHPVKLGWDMLMMCLVIYYGLSVPVRMAFITSTEEDAFTFWFDLVANFIFIADIIMNFITAVRLKGALVTDYKVIAHEYLRLWFWIDMIASVPIDMFMTKSSGSLQINKLLRLLRIFKLFRVFRMARILKRLEQFTKFNPAVLRLAKIFFSLSLTWHWMACTYWLSASLENFAQNEYFVREQGENLWVPPPELWCDAPSDSAICADLECFDTGDCPASMNMRYVSSFFWAIMVTTGIGRDIMPVTYMEHVLSVVLIISGVLMGAVIIGSASSALSNLDAGNAEKRQKLEAIQVYMRQRRVPNDLQRRIREYYEYMWSSHQSLDEKDGGILGDLHHSLKLELQVSLNRRLIESVPLFAMISDDDCLIDMIEKLTSMIFIPGEYVLLEGEIGSEMYVIVRGLVQVLKGPGKVEVAVLKDSDVFGEHSLISRQPRNASVRALTYCDFLVLQKPDFDAVMFQYPQYFQSLQKEVIRKYTSGWDRVRTVLRMARNVRMLGLTPDMNDLLLGGDDEEEEEVVVVPKRTKRLTFIGNRGAAAAPTVVKKGGVLAEPGKPLSSPP